MENRYYLEDLPISQNGKIFGHKLRGVDTSIHFIPKLQLKDELRFSITFHDTGLAITGIVDGTNLGEDQYLSYANDMFDNGFMEEYYKTILFIVKRRLMEMVRYFKQTMTDYKATGMLPYYVFGDLESYKKSFKRELLTLKTLDIQETDLEFFTVFKQLENE